MKFYSVLFMLFFALMQTPVMVQATEADSLIQLLPELEGITKVKTLNRLTWILRTSELEKAQKYGEQAIELAEEQKFWEELATAYNYTGVIFRNRGNLMSSINYFYRALNISEKHNLDLQTSYSNLNIGNILGRQNKYEEATKYTRTAIEFFQKVEDPRGEAYGWIRLGEIYRNQEKYDESLKVYRQCLTLREKHFPKNKYGLMAIKNRIGEIYEMTEKYEDALEVYQESLRLSQEAKENIGMAGNSLSVAKMYHKLNYPMDSVLYYAESSLEQAQAIGITAAIRNATEFLVEIYEKQQKYQKAYELMRLYSEVQAKLIREHNNKNVQSLQIEYQAKKQGIKIELLKQDKLLSRFLIAVLGVGVIFGVLWLYYMRKVNKQRKADYKLLKAQKYEIEAQAENLVEANQSIAHQKRDLETKNQSLEETLQNLEKAQTQIAEAEKMASLGEMVAGISTELNNPLNFIYTGTESLRGILEDLKEVLDKYDENEISAENLVQFQEQVKQLKYELEYEEIDEDISNLLADIYDGAQNTNRIVAGLRTFTQAGKKASSTDIHQNLDATLIVLNHKRGESVEIIQDYDSKLPYITCFPSLMNQVFMNILSYSLDSVGEVGQIKIMTRRTDDEMIFIQFSDTGKGISTSTLASLFESVNTFDEINDSEHISFELSADIIQKHQGRIMATSEQGQGTTFKITLPIYPKFKHSAEPQIAF